MRDAKLTALYLILLSLWFCFFYGTSDWLAAAVPYRIPMEEPSWPFQPEWSPVYLSLNLLLVWAFVRSAERPQLFTGLLLQTLIAWPLFVLFPLQSLAVPEQPDSWWFNLADTINLSQNYLPSLHVSYAFTSAYFLRRPLAFAWAVAIALSTLFTYQHYPIDVVAGVALAFAAARLVESRARVLSLCLGELVRCTARHRRYGLISVGLLLALVFRPRSGWRALVGFCYLQRIDDLLDGHLSCSVEPDEIAREQIGKWESGEFGDGDLDRLAQKLRRALPKSPNIVSVIEEMRLDRRRVKENLLLSEERLSEHLERTFALSLDLMLAAMDAEVGSTDAPTLLPLLGWCSVVRDLEEDLSLGLVNVPEEVVKSQDFEGWFQKELEKAERAYRRTEKELEALQGRDGVRLLTLFHRSVRKYLRCHRPEQAAETVRRALVSSAR